MEAIWESITGWAKDNLSDFGMIKIYLACAVAGGAVLIGQTGLNLFGIGADTDIDPDLDVDAMDGADSLNFLSIRALAGFLTFFGLVGWGGTNSEWGTAPTVLAAFASGATVMVVIAVMMRFFARMAQSGTVNPRAAVGQTATVYLKVPGEMSGKGKITVSLQDRSMEFEAMTAGPELATGSECRIVKLITASTFEVAPLH